MDGSKLLYEVRNEIIHPTHMPSGTLNNTPSSMSILREMNLLNSTMKSDSDYIWIDQLKSHKLFYWAFSVIEEVVTVILRKHYSIEDNWYSEHLKTYATYKMIDIF